MGGFGTFLLGVGVFTIIVTIIVNIDISISKKDEKNTTSDMSNEEKTEYLQNIKQKKTKTIKIIAWASVAVVLGIIMMNSAPTKYTKELSNLENYIEQERIGDALYSINEFEKKRDDMTDKEVKKLDELIPKMKAMSENKAKDDIQTAEMKIRNKDYVVAGDILEEIINNKYVTEQTRKEAEEILSPIAKQVVVEKSKTAIIGTFEKDTGVQYTFEKDGHMSVSLAYDYNVEKGIGWDRTEIKGILKEIDEWGEIVRGGTWQYEGISNGKGLYSLFYYGTNYNCYFVGDNKLCIESTLGIGEAHYLKKK